MRPVLLIFLSAAATAALPSPARADDAAKARAKCNSIHEFPGLRCDHNIAEYTKEIRSGRLASGRPLSAEDLEGDFLNRGFWYAKEADYAHAIADYNEAIRLKPNDQAAFARRGTAYFNQKEYARALVDWNEALRLETDDDYSPFVLYDRGVAELRLGRAAEGRADIHQATEEDPDVAGMEALDGVKP